jgi:hypothetical protein
MQEPALPAAITVDGLAAGFAAAVGAVATGFAGALAAITGFAGALVAVGAASGFAGTMVAVGAVAAGEALQPTTHTSQAALKTEMPRAVTRVRLRR